ncbi:hypothetical protein [Microbulbifer aggregans]|uniref:hypothetical protein n=1 Tax=Microbulbifer aggregans TaxID=1769779 RepID=UPI001CFF35A5|nr:hypothetical protein [Microbulbifer aggregans]
MKYLLSLILVFSISAHAGEEKVLIGDIDGAIKIFTENRQFETLLVSSDNGSSLQIYPAEKGYWVEIPIESFLVPRKEVAYFIEATECERASGAELQISWAIKGSELQLMRYLKQHDYTNSPECDIFLDRTHKNIGWMKRYKFFLKRDEEALSGFLYGIQQQVLEDSSKDTLKLRLIPSIAP